MLEFKIVKPSDTRWLLAHEHCVKIVKENYCAIVIAFNNIYEETHEPEALGISKALSKKSTISAMFLLDYVLPQVANLSKILQTEKAGCNITENTENIVVKRTPHISICESHNALILAMSNSFHNIVSKA